MFFAGYSPKTEALGSNQSESLKEQDGKPLRPCSGLIQDNIKIVKIIK